MMIIDEFPDKTLDEIFGKQFQRNVIINGGLVRVVIFENRSLDNYSHCCVHHAGIDGQQKCKFCTSSSKVFRTVKRWSY